jgi:hypothetical protein
VALPNPSHAADESREKRSRDETKSDLTLAVARPENGTAMCAGLSMELAEPSIARTTSSAQLWRSRRRQASFGRVSGASTRVPRVWAASASCRSYVATPASSWPRLSATARWTASSLRGDVRSRSAGALVKCVVETNQGQRCDRFSRAGTGRGIGDAHRPHRLDPDKFARHELVLAVEPAQKRARLRFFVLLGSSRHKIQPRPADA